jgi:hypothetical protein
MTEPVSFNKIKIIALDRQRRQKLPANISARQRSAVTPRTQPLLVAGYFRGLNFA